MFSINTGTLDRIYDTLGADAASGLRGLGNCSLPLTHRAPVSILTSARLNARTAALTLARSPILPGDNLTLPDANGDMPNGWALNVVAGAANFQGPMVVHVGWAKAAGNWVNVAGGAAWESYVDCVLCTDKAGTEDPQGRTVRVYLPRTLLQDPNVRTGDVIRFQIDGEGSAICLSDVLDGKINEVRDLGGNEDPTDYATGLRGWFIADGNNGTDNLSGANVGLGWTGSGDFANVGDPVSSDMTGGTISGNGGTTSLSIVNGTTGITVSTPGLSHTPAGGVTTIQTEFCIFDIDDTGDEFDGVDNNANYRNDESPQDKLTTQGHRHDITMSNVTDGIADHAAASCSVTDVGHGHTGTVSNNSIASGLSISGGGGTHGQGTVVVRIQRVN